MCLHCVLPIGIAADAQIPGLVGPIETALGTASPTRPVLFQRRLPAGLHLWHHMCCVEPLLTEGADAPGEEAALN
jgi:hypothetical protein